MIKLFLGGPGTGKSREAIRIALENGDTQYIQYYELPLQIDYLTIAAAIDPMRELVVFDSIPPERLQTLLLALRDLRDIGGIVRHNERFPLPQIIICSQGTRADIFEQDDPRLSLFFQLFEIIQFPLDHGATR